MNELVKTVFILNYLFFGWILYEIEKGWITFGLGLGDYLYMYGVILWVIIITVAFWLTRKVDFKTRRLLGIIILTGLLASCVFTILMLTIYRGPELPWNGHLFL